MTTTVSITEEVKEKLVRVAADLQKKKGRRVDLNETIDYLLSTAREKRPDLLEKALTSIPHDFDRDYKLLMKERRSDDHRTNR